MRKYKLISTKSAQIMGEALHRARCGKKLTLKIVSSKIGVDVGQLSRFESGKFKTISKNLHLYSSYLQIKFPDETDDLDERFRNFAARSDNHRAACELILDVLEKLG